MCHWASSGNPLHGLCHQAMVFIHSSQAGMKGVQEVFFPISLPSTWSWRFKFKSKETIDQKLEVCCLKNSSILVGTLLPQLRAWVQSLIREMRSYVAQKEKKRKKRKLLPCFSRSIVLGHLGALAAWHHPIAQLGKG